MMGVEQAIDNLHREYLELLARDNAILQPDAAFDLLYGHYITDEKEVDRRKRDLEEMCRDIKPMGAVAQALLQASRGA